MFNEPRHTANLLLQFSEGRSPAGGTQEAEELVLCRASRPGAGSALRGADRAIWDVLGRSHRVSPRLSCGESSSTERGVVVPDLDLGFGVNGAFVLPFCPHLGFCAYMKHKESMTWPSWALVPLCPGAFSGDTEPKHLRSLRRAALPGHQCYQRALLSPPVPALYLPNVTGDRDSHGSPQELVWGHCVASSAPGLGIYGHKKEVWGYMGT